MDKELLDAFRNTDYLVCLDVAEWACIRIDQTLPESLQKVVSTRPWGFITAWNPRSELHAPADNLAAQHELLAALRASAEVIHPAIGVGAAGWNEPSLFAIGIDTVTLDALGRHHRQNAYVHGHGDDLARLRLLDG